MKDLKHVELAAAEQAQQAEPVAWQLFKQALFVGMERNCVHYLMANAHGRRDGALKAHNHEHLCRHIIAVVRGCNPDQVRWSYEDEYQAVHDGTQALTSYLDEVIGFPLDSRPDYDDLTPKFFDKFFELAMQALGVSPAAKPPAVAEPVARDVLMALAKEVHAATKKSALAWAGGHPFPYVSWDNVELVSIVDRYADQLPALEVPFDHCALELAELVMGDCGISPRSSERLKERIAARIDCYASLAVRNAAESVEAALPPGVAVPEGWKLVPVEPTREMIDAMPPVEEVGYWAMYEAAIAAAPQAAQLSATPSAALADIAAERRRQMEVEGWTPEHDDKYHMHTLTSAAGCYAMHTLAYPAGDPPPGWPWDASWWKPSDDPRRNWVKAGALIAAEIERFDRAAQKGGA